MDNMYLTEALTFEPAKLGRPPGPQDLNKVFEFRRLVTASLILTWVAMMAVKFSFLALFKRLIDRIYSLAVYWWVVVAFNLAVTGYGASVYVIACPHFSGMKVVNCLGGETRHRTMQYAISQLVLDVFGDLLILYIPLQLIWQVKLRLIQKFALACSLCLTVVVIIFTVTRASGLEWHGKLDVLWEVYFQIVAAEVGLILVSVSAFRALFVARARKQQSPQRASSPSFLTKGIRTLKRIVNSRRWMSKPSKEVSDEQKDDDVGEGVEEKRPRVHGSTSTGMQTVVEDDQGLTTKGGAELSVIGSYEEANYDMWPVREDGRHSTCSRCGQHLHSNAV
ncbi:MAG: hypothetical protein L6R41_001605 [Letrouitia leprolyta]|nr:MAG: hypothetical protein L6R41_001605 [Letrouitia leprolyta]